MMCRSGSVRSFGIKRVCSIASADGIDSHCMSQQQGSIMIPVPGSSNNLQAAAGSPGAVASAHAKRSSKTGSSISSQEHNGQVAAAAAGQEAVSDSLASARRLAPIKTSVPRGPRLRLNGRLLSPEEAQKHLQAVAAAAAAASAGRSLSRAQSPAVTCPGITSSPAGPHGSSASLSTGAPCNSAGNSSGMCGPAALKSAQACAGAISKLGAAAAVPAPSAAPMRTQVLSALDVLPENFIPTPEGVGTWHTLASTLEDGSSGATSRGVSGAGSPLVCSSYTELLLAEDAQAVVPPAALRMDEASFTARPGAGLRRPPAAAPGRVSAFAGHSAEPWPIQQQQAAGPMLLASAGSANQIAGGMSLGSSCPVGIPMHNNSSGWNSSKLLGGSSVSGSNGSSGNSSLAASLAPQGSSAVTDTELVGLSDLWGAQQLQQQQVLVMQGALRAQAQSMPQQQQGLVAFSAGPVTAGPASRSAGASAGLGGSSAAAGAVPAWKPAFGAAANAASGSAAASSGNSSGMVPTPGLSTVGSAPSLAALPQQLQPQQRAQVVEIKTASSKTKRNSKAATSKAAKPTLQLQVPAQVQAAPQPQVQQLQPMQPDNTMQPQLQAQQLPQQLMVVAEGGQQVVLSQQELMAVLQQNMAASFASGYMMATSMNGCNQNGQQTPPQLQLQPQPPLLKPVASIGAFVMPPAAAAPAGAPTAAAAAGGSGAACMPLPTAVLPAAVHGGAQQQQVVAGDTTAAAAAALGSSGDMVGLVGTNGVDDILPSLQDLLTDCY